MIASRILGNKGEELALKVLQKKGYKIVEKNFRTNFGEIDIIAKDGETLVFVEVKTRLSTKYGLPEEAVTERKLKRMKKTIDFYMNYKTNLTKMRIEIIAIKFDGTEPVSYRLIKLD